MIILIYICILLGILINLLCVYYVVTIYSRNLNNFKNMRNMLNNKFDKLNKCRNYFKPISNSINNYNIIQSNLIPLPSKLIFAMLNLLWQVILNKLENRCKMVLYMYLYYLIAFIANNIDPGVFLEYYVEFISIDDTFLCSCRTPETDFWDSYLLTQLHPLPNRPPFPRSKYVPSKWGPGKPWGEGPNKPGGPNGPGDPRVDPASTRPRNRDEESNKDFFETVLNSESKPVEPTVIDLTEKSSPIDPTQTTVVDTILESAGENTIRAESPLIETWKTYLQREQRHNGEFKNDNLSYRTYNPGRRERERSINIARNAYTSVTRGSRPRMHHIEKTDRRNIMAAYWNKFKDTKKNESPNHIHYSYHKEMMRGKDYNLSVKEVLEALGRL